MIDVPKSLKKTKSFRCSVRDYIRRSFDVFCVCCVCCDLEQSMKDFVVYVVKGKKNDFVAVLGLLIKGYSKKNSEELSVVKFRMILLGF